MKKLYASFFFSVLSLLIAPAVAFATHIVGGSLTYQAGAANSYTVTLRLYRDCCPTCAALAASYNVNIRNADGTNATPATVTTNSVSITPVTATLPPCATAPASPPCVQEYIYRGTVTLPSAPGGYHMYFSLCCRNTTLTNTNASDQTQPEDGETFYAFIPGYKNEWIEGFAGLANGTTSDAGATAWTRTVSTTPATTGQVNAERFEMTGANASTIWLENFDTLANGSTSDAGVTAWTRTITAVTASVSSTPPTAGVFRTTGANNGSMTLTTQTVSIASYLAGVNLSVTLQESSAMDAGDSYTVYYSVDGGAPVSFGTASGNYGTDVVTTTTPITGNNISIIIALTYDAASAGEVVDIDNIQITANGYVRWASQVIAISTYTSGVNLSAVLSESSTLEASDNITIAYSLNGGALVNFTTNGSISDDFGTATATTTGLSGTTIQIFVTVKYDNASAGELYQIDRVSVYDNTFRSNSSPVFGSPPPLYLCAVNSFTISYSASDADGDSLVYSLYDPYSDYAPTFSNNTASFTPIIWIAGYSASSPFNSGGPAVTLNTSTGDLTGVANTLGQYVFGVKCSEYRSGVLLSEIVRDFQANVVTCPPFVPATPTASVVNTGPVCTGQNLTLSASSTDPSPTFSWTGPNSFTSTLQNPVISGVTTAASGTYSVVSTVTGCNSAAGTVTVTVNVTPAAPVASASPNPVCAGSTLSLTASSTGSTYSWTGPNSYTSTSQNPTFTASTTAYSGTYSVYATSSAGCVSTTPGTTSSVTVTATPAAPAASSNSPVCTGATLSLTATSTGTTYSWSGPNSFTSTSQNPTIGGITSADAGTYSVTASTNGCTSPVATTSVTVNTTPSAPTAGSNTPVCAGNTLSLTATATGTTYNWTGPNSFTSTSQNPTISAVTTAAGGTYSVTATTAGCTGPAGTTSVTINPGPGSPTAGSNSPVCSGSTLSLTCSTVTGATYSWTGPNSFTSTSQNPTIGAVTTAASGTYTVVASVAGCSPVSATTSVTINQTPAAPAASSNSPVCAGSTLSLTATATGTTYSWTGPNSFTSTSQNPTITGITTAGSGTYSVTATSNGCTGPAGTTSVTINATPAAPAAGSNSPVCSGNTLSLTATATGTTYSWTGPNSFTSTSQNPTIGAVSTAATGNYSVTATTGGCTSTAGTVSVTINPTPSAPAAGSNSPVCSGSTLSLTATATGTTYNWAGPNSFTSTSQNPVIGGVTTAAGGTYSVTATANGCTSSAGTTSVTINATPSAPTAGSNSPVCSGNTLSLTATATGTTYNWTGPNSFTSTSQNPTIGAVTTAASGNYSVTSTTGGCTSAAGTASVTINQTPSAPMAGSNSPICAGNTLSLTASAAGTTYNWTGPNSFTSTNQNPTIGAASTAASGTYSVTATASGCTGPAGTTSVTVNPGPSAPTAGSNTPVCSGNTLSLTCTTVTGASYSWNGPNSFTSTDQNPTISGVTTSASGTYTVVASVPGCSNVSATTSVTINQTPAAPVASSNSPICVGVNLSLTASSTGTAYNWTGPNSFTSTSQNPTITAAGTAASGTYSVTATANGCTGAAGTTSVTVNPPPSSPTLGSNSPVCSGNTLSLTATSLVGANYSWSGPNSFTSTNQNPTIAAITTAGSGTYSMTAAVPGCPPLSTETISVTINQTPAAPAAGSNSPVCVGGNLSLTASSTGSTYAWSGPNSFTSTSQNPVISGAGTVNAGTYTVNTTSAAGCLSPNATTAVVINPPPGPPTAGSNSPVCSGTTLSLTASTVAGGSYNWTGPNSFTSASQNPTIGSVTTAASGTYSVTVTVPGCVTSAPGTTAVTINQTPAAPSASNNGPLCIGTTLSLSASSPGSPAYAWSGPNSFTSTAQNPTIGSVTTANSGIYSVTATENGCTSPAGTTSVTVSPPPAAPTASSNSPICVGNTLSLTASTVTGATYTWNGPNGYTSASQNPTIGGVTTSESGTYSVTATVSGCTGSAGTTSVTINPPPPAPTLGSNAPICAGSDLSLTAGTVTGASTYNWTGPNSFTSSVQNPSITAATVAASGTYSATVTVPGCPLSPAGTISVTVNGTPSITSVGSNSPACVGNNISLTATGTGATYSWSGPNGFTSTAQNPVISGITSADAGTYTVNTTSAAGCTSTNSTTSVVVNPPPSAPTAGSNSPVCSGNTLSLTASAVTGATVYNWSGPSSYTSTVQNPTIAAVTTSRAGTYSVTAFVPGCPLSPAGTVTVVINQTPAAPTASSNSPVCSGNDISLTASTTGSPTYSWTGPGGFTSTSQNPVITAATSSNAGTYSVAATENGCTGPRGTTSVTVNPIPAAPAAGSNSPLCTGTTLSLTASTVGGATYAWSGPNGFTSTSQNPTISGVSTDEAGTYSVSVTVSGCAGPAGTVSVSIAPPPAAPTAGSNSPVCSGNTLSLTASTIAGATSYNWTGPNSFTSSVQDPTIGSATTLASGTYSVSATVAGCTGPAGTVSVTVDQTPSAPSVTNNGPLCVGDNLSLTASTLAGATYSWSGPNGFTSTTQNPVILSATTAEGGTYSVTVTQNGCTGPAGSTSVIVSPPPTTPTAGSNSPVCSGTALSLTATTFAGASYNWSGPNSFTSTAQNPVIGAVSTLASGTYSVFVQIGSCTSPTGTVSVTINQTPAAPTAGSNAPICSGADLSLTASTVGGSTYSWTGPGGFTSTAQDPVITAATTANSGTYSVSATENGCTGPAGTVSVTINAIPSAPTAGNNGPLCVGDNLSLTASAVAGASYAWSGPNGFTSTAQNPSIPAVTTAEAGTYSVNVTVAGCNGPDGTTTVIVAPPPAAPTAGSNSPICSGNDLSLTASTTAGASYNWTGPNGFTSTLQDPVITAASTAEAGTYSVIITIGSCTSPAGTVAVTVNQTPAAPSASSNSPLCVGDNLSLTASTLAGVNYSWSGPNGFTSTLQNPTIPGVTSAEAGTYSVTADANGCMGPVATTTVVINPPPSAPTAGSNSPVCSGTLLSLTASTVAGATYSWTGPNGFSSTVQNPTIGSVSTAAAGTYSVTATVPGCPTTAAGTVSVTIDPSPAAPVAGSNAPICSGADLSLTASTVGGSTYSWTGPGGFTSTAQDPVITAATTANSGTYSVSATENGCTGPAGTVSVTINAIPSAPTAGNNGPLCVGDNLSLTASAVAGASYAWSGPNGFTSTSQNPAIAGVSTSEAGTYSVNVTVAGCNGPDGTTTVIVAPPPAAPTAGSNSPICSGNDLSLTASTTAGASYNWTGPNGFTSTLQDPVITAASTADAGTYSVIITIGSCTSPAGTVSVSVDPAPPAPVTNSNSPVCIGNNLSLSASTVSNVTYSWTGPSGFTSTLQNPSIPSVTGANAGTYQVILTSTINGCTSPVASEVVVVSSPATVNAGTDQTVCANNPTPLSGTVTGGSGNGIWTTPNGAGVFTPNNTTLTASYTPDISDTLAGNILLILTSTGNGGCPADKDTVVIHVDPGPVVNAGPDQSICANNYSSVAVNGSVQVASGGLWSSLGTGSFTAAASVLTNTYVPTPADSASGSVQLVLTSTGNGNCSPVTDTLLITFTPAPVVNAGADIPVCLGDTFAVLNGSVTGGASTGAWSTTGSGTFSPNNTTLNATYYLSSADTAAGGATLVLTSTNFGNCAAVTDTVQIYMTPAPVVNAGADVTVCANNDTVLLSGSVSAGASTGYWSTSGSGTFIPDSSALNASYVPSSADTSAGSVVLTLTSTNGCRPVSDSLLVTITDAPVVNAGPDAAVCGASPVALNGSVSVASGGIWTSSGNGVFTPDNLTLNATYTPGSNDTSVVTLVLTSSGNGQCLAVSDTMTILIGKKPVAGFSHTPGCTGQLLVFNDTSVTTNPLDTIVTWNWTIAGATDTLQNPSHSYSITGTDTVILIVTTTSGCSDTVMHVVNINPTPSPAFTYTVDCVADSVYFTNTSTIPSGTISSWNWNFGDGNSSTLMNPVHSYSTTGTFTVSLIATSDSGCNAVFTDTVTSCLKVQAGFTSLTTICAGQTVTFTDTSVTFNNDTVVVWNWAFGDGGTDTVQNPVHTYSASGTYTVSMAITTNSGASDTAYQVILVNPLPTAFFTALTSCSLDSVYFTDASTIAGGTISSWYWNFGDTNTSMLQNPVHHYDSAGTYTVTLTVTSDSGCSATYADTILKLDDVMGGFSDSADCQFNVQFSDTSLTSTGDSILTWTWDFGDGSTGNTAQPSHSYTAAGTYTVQLVVTTAGGCTDTVSDTVMIVPSPSADFAPPGGTYYMGVPISFTDLSGNAAAWMWTFGDGSSDTVQNPVHTYGQNGMMNVTLIITNSAGCPDTVTYPFKINPNTVGVPGAFTPNNDNVNDVIRVLGGPMKEMDWTIYNEWGNAIFHSTEQSEGWDGTYRGKPQPATRYVYTLKGLTVSDDVIDMKGEITIMR